MDNQQTKNLVSTLLILCSSEAISGIQASEIKKLAKNLKQLLPMPVTEYGTYYNSHDSAFYFFELCPCCDAHLERTYQQYCINCGQKLKWISKKNMTMKKQPPL